MPPKCIIHTTKILSGLWSVLEFPLNNNSNFISIFGFDEGELSWLNFCGAYF